ADRGAGVRHRPVGSGGQAVFVHQRHGPEAVHQRRVGDRPYGGARGRSAAAGHRVPARPVCGRGGGESVAGRQDGGKGGGHRPAVRRVAGKIGRQARVEEGDGGQREERRGTPAAHGARRKCSVLVLRRRLGRQGGTGGTRLLERPGGGEGAPRRSEQSG